MREHANDTCRRSVVLLILYGVCLALGSCSGVPRDSQPSHSSDASETIAAEPIQPILVSPDSCPVDRAGDRVDRWTEVEVVEVQPGRPLHMRGCESEGASFVNFSYLRPLPVTGLHLLEYALYEGGGWIVVNSLSGRQWFLSGMPRLSPDRRWLATTLVDLQAGYDRNHLDVWAVEADSLRRVLALEGGDEWGGINLRWRSNDTIEFQRIARRGGPDLRFDSATARVIRSGAEWLPNIPPDP